MDWTTGNHSELVQLPNGGPRLFLRATGPQRPDEETPAIVIEHGLGSGVTEWSAVVRLLSRFARVYIYERAGHRPSDAPTKDPTPPNIAADLHALLTAAGVAPPYILVGHSYGGTLVRQFLADYGKDDIIHGMVLVDATPIRTVIPNSWPELLGDATYESVVGLQANHKLTPEEWEKASQEWEINGASTGIGEEERKYQREFQPKLQSRLLATKHPLGHWPLSVMFCDESMDFRNIYLHGMQYGHGSPEARDALRRRLVDMSKVDEAGMREMLALSTNSRFVEARGEQRTHNVHVVDPEFVAKEIEWVYRLACGE